MDSLAEAERYFMGETKVQQAAVDLAAALTAFRHIEHGGDGPIHESAANPYSADELAARRARLDADKRWFATVDALRAEVQGLRAGHPCAMMGLTDRERELLEEPATPCGNPCSAAYCEAHDFSDHDTDPETVLLDSMVARGLMRKLECATTIHYRNTPLAAVALLADAATR